VAQFKVLDSSVNKGRSYRIFMAEHAEVCFIDELVDAALRLTAGRYIRTTGILDSYDAAANIAIFSYKGHTIVVDMQLCNLGLQLGSMYQIFGTLTPVAAKVARTLLT
jgi:hypothetical protein